jgi:pantothenate synthetase
VRLFRQTAELWSLCRWWCAQLRDADNLSLVTDVIKQPTLLAVAAKFPAQDKGTVRLIDNMVLGTSTSS